MLVSSRNSEGGDDFPQCLEDAEAGVHRLGEVLLGVTVSGGLAVDGDSSDRHMYSRRGQRDRRPPGRALRLPRLGRRAATGRPPRVSQYSIFASTTPAQNSTNPSGSRLLSAASSEVASAGFASSQSQDTTNSHAAHTKPASPGFGTRQRRGWHSHNTSAPPGLVQHHLESSGSALRRDRIRGCHDGDRVRVHPVERQAPEFIGDLLQEVRSEAA